MPKINLGSHMDSAGTYVVRARIGSHPKSMNIQVGLNISLIGVLLILLERYSKGAQGGVILPSPRFTPSIAAKCIGLTPISRTMGRSIGVARTQALQSSMSMPNIIMNMFNIKSIAYLFVEIE